MIKNFTCKDTERLFERETTRKWTQGIRKVASRKLRMLDAAVNLKDLLIPPGNRPEKLTGDRKGQHSIRINRQWRICFKWKNGDAYNVEITDYH